MSLTVCFVSQNWLAPLQQSWQQLPPMTFQWVLLHVGTQTWCGDWHCNSMSWAIVLVTLYLGEGVRARRSYSEIVSAPLSALQLRKTAPFVPLSLSSSCSETVYRTTQRLVRDCCSKSQGLGMPSPVSPVPAFMLSMFSVHLPIS